MHKRIVEIEQHIKYCKGAIGLVVSPLLSYVSTAVEMHKNDSY